MLLSSVYNLASVCLRNTKVAIECYTPWIFYNLDSDPNSDDPAIGPFILLDDVFTTSVLSKNIALDKLKLPPDDCQLIASAIVKETAIAVCDGSFDPNDCLGTAAFLMAANKKHKNTLTGAN